MTTGQQDSEASEAGGGPTVLRMLLGTQLRKLREARGITRAAAAWHIRGSESKISRMELGRVGFKQRDVSDLLTLYGISDDTERQALLNLARDANTQGWWHRYSDVMPGWFQAYVGLEAAASFIRTYEVQFIPGLLQTEDYARAVISFGHAATPAHEIERRVNLRMTRQKILTRPTPPRLWAVVDEAALRRPIGGVPVLRDQLRRLIETTALPTIQLQVIPNDTGGHIAEGGPFTIIRFPDNELPAVVYVEYLTGALYLEKPEEVDTYVAVAERLALQAEPPHRTIEIIRAILRDLAE